MLARNAMSGERALRTCSLTLTADATTAVVGFDQFTSGGLELYAARVDLTNGTSTIAEVVASFMSAIDTQVIVRRAGAGYYIAQTSSTGSIILHWFNSLATLSSGPSVTPTTTQLAAIDFTVAPPVLGSADMAADTFDGIPGVILSYGMDTPALTSGLVQFVSIDGVLQPIGALTTSTRLYGVRGLRRQRQGDDRPHVREPKRAGRVPRAAATQRPLHTTHLRHGERRGDRRKPLIHPRRHARRQRLDPRTPQHDHPNPRTATQPHRRRHHRPQRPRHPHKPNNILRHRDRNAAPQRHMVHRPEQLHRSATHTQRHTRHRALHLHIRQPRAHRRDGSRARAERDAVGPRPRRRQRLGRRDRRRITNDTTPTFTGTTEGADCEVSILRNGTVVATVTTASAAYSVTIPAVADGAATYTAQATCPGDLPSAESGGLPVTVDTVGPAHTAAPDLQAASDTGTSGSDNITEDTTPTFDGTTESRRGRPHGAPHRRHAAPHEGPAGLAASYTTAGYEITSRHARRAGRTARACSPATGRQHRWRIGRPARS